MLNSYLNHGDAIEVAETAHTGYVRVRGRATFKLVPDFRDFVAREISQGKRGVLVDLSACETLDSTFVGVLTSLTLRCRRQGGTSVKLFNVSDHLLDILNTLGLLRVLDIVEAADIQSLPFQQLATAAHSKIEVARLMLDAHETLAGLNEENAAQFKNVVEFLSKGLE